MNALQKFGAAAALSLMTLGANQPKAAAAMDCEDDCSFWWNVSVGNAYWQCYYEGMQLYIDYWQCDVGEDGCATFVWLAWHCDW